MARSLRLPALLCLSVSLLACTRLITTPHDAPPESSGTAVVAVAPAPVRPAVLPAAPPAPSGPTLYLASGIALFLDDAAPAAAPVATPAPVARAASPAAAVISAASSASPARVQVSAQGAAPASTAAECAVASPAGYAGPAVAGAVPVTAVTVVRGLSWWVLGRRHALTYADLARLNALSESVVRAGRGLREGRQVYVVARTGAHRLPALRFCGAEAPARAPSWRLYPEGERWRSPVDGKVPSDPASIAVPALGDPYAVWVRNPRARTFEQWASRGALSLEALLRYNGVESAVGLGSKRPSGALALPPS